MQGALNLDFRIPTEWARIDAAREAIGSCLYAVFADADLKDALSMVSAELLENAVKYGKPDPDGVRIRLLYDGQEVCVEVTNLVEQTSHHTKVLQSKLDWIRAFHDPADAYTAALAQVYERTDEEAAIGGGLGLVRIVYEGGCRLECCSTADSLSVIARYSRPKPTV